VHYQVDPSGVVILGFCVWPIAGDSNELNKPAATERIADYFSYPQYHTKDDPPNEPRRKNT
jgi:hypothetical protein